MFKTAESCKEYWETFWKKFAKVIALGDPIQGSQKQMFGVYWVLNYNSFTSNGHLGCILRQTFA